MDHVRLQIQSTEPIDCNVDARCIESIVVRCDGTDGWVMEIVLQKGTVPDLRPGRFVVVHPDTIEFPLHTGGVYTITADEKMPQPAPPTDPKRPDVERFKKDAVAVGGRTGEDEYRADRIVSLCDHTLELEKQLKVIFAAGQAHALVMLAKDKADSLLAGLVEAVKPLDALVDNISSNIKDSSTIISLKSFTAGDCRRLTAALTAAKQHFKGKEKKDDAEDGSKPAQG